MPFMDAMEHLTTGQEFVASEREEGKEAGSADSRTRAEGGYMAQGYMNAKPSKVRARWCHRAWVGQRVSLAG